MPTPRAVPSMSDIRDYFVQLSTSLAAAAAAAATTLPEKDADTTDDPGLLVVARYEIEQVCKHLGNLCLQLHARRGEPPTMLCTDAEKLHSTSDRSSDKPRSLWCELQDAARAEWMAQAERNEEANAQCVKNHLDMLKEAREAWRDNGYDTIVAAGAMATDATPAK